MKWMPFLVNFRLPNFLFVKGDLSIFHVMATAKYFRSLTTSLRTYLHGSVFLFRRRLGPALQSNVFNHILFHFPICVTFYLIKPIQMVSTKACNQWSSCCVAPLEILKIENSALLYHFDLQILRCQILWHIGWWWQSFMSTPFWSMCFLLS